MKENNIYLAFIGIVAIVAIVGITLGISNTGKPGTSPSRVDALQAQQDPLVGQAYVGTRSSADDAHIRAVYASLSSEHLNERDEPYMREEQPDAAPVITQPVKGSIVLTEKDMNNFPRSGGCAVIPQSAFTNKDNQGLDFVLDFTSGCYAVEQDILFDGTIYVRGGNPDGTTYFTSNGYTIKPRNESRNTYGIVVEGTNANSYQTIRNTVVEGYLSGVLVTTRGRVYDTTSKLNTGDWPNGMGFVVMNGGSVTGSTANNNDYGFWVGGGSVTGSTAEYNNWYGFRVYSGGSVTGSTAECDNWDGFYVFGGSVTGSTARSNNRHGFVVSGGVVRDSTARSNNRHGFYVSNTAVVEDSRAYDNGQTAEYYGFALFNNAVARRITSDNNRNGVFVGDVANGDIARLEGGIRVCGNDDRGIYVYGGIVTGTYQSNKPIQGAGDWSGAIIVSCSSGGGSGGSPIMAKMPVQIQPR